MGILWAMLMGMLCDAIFHYIVDGWDVMEYMKYGGLQSKKDEVHKG